MADVARPHLNRTHGRDAPLFRGLYKANLVEGETYLAEMIRYIHPNPVQARIV